MAEDTLLTLEFATRTGNPYVYDGVTNRIFFTPEPMREMIRGYRKKGREHMIAEMSSSYPAEVLEDYYDQIRRWVDVDGAFFLREHCRSESISAEQDRRHRRECRSPCLTLSVTNDCNLACNYCIQDKAQEAMTFSVAKAGIDRFFEVNADPTRKAIDSVAVGFYGGEPLLEFDLIRRCVDYVKSRWDHSTRVRFLITTNGTLLTDEVSDFLAKHDVDLSISLDGPKEEHDRNRVTKQGNGTFDLVLRNLMRLRERHSEYFRTKTGVMATFDFMTDMKETLEWFQANRATLPPLVRAAMASRTEKTCSRFTCEVEQGSRRRLEELFSVMEDMLVHDPTGETLGTPWYTFFYAQVTSIVDRRRCPAWRLSRLGCWPGVPRLALYPDGSFRVCDRIETHHSIGDIDAGIDLQKVDAHVSEYEEWIAAKRCHACIAQQVCSTCFAHTIGVAATDFSCEARRAALPGELTYWYSIFERNPEVMRFMRRGTHTLLDEAF